jgi:hypothetical protein
MSEPLERLARRVAGDPFFLSSALAGYQRRHGLDDAGLAASLGCPVAVLPSLRLCRMPGTAADQRTFDQDVNDIARRFGIGPAALARVLDDGPPEGAARVAW